MHKNGSSTSLGPIISRRSSTLPQEEEEGEKERGDESGDEEDKYAASIQGTVTSRLNCGQSVISGPKSNPTR